MDVGKSKIVWSGNNGCHMSQDDVIKLGVSLEANFHFRGPRLFKIGDPSGRQSWP